MRYICVLSRRIEEVYAPDVSLIPYLLNIGKKESILGIFDENYVMRMFYEKGDIVITQYRWKDRAGPSATDFKIHPPIGMAGMYLDKYWETDEDVGHFVIGYIHPIQKGNA